MTLSHQKYIQHHVCGRVQELTGRMRCRPDWPGRSRPRFHARRSCVRQTSSALLLFTCGGTGGHVFPAVAVADRIKRIKPEVDIEFVGSRERLEWVLVPKSGYRIHSVPCASIHRPLTSLKNVRRILVQMIGVLKAVWILVVKRPDAGKTSCLEKFPEDKVSMGMVASTDEIYQQLHRSWRPRDYVSR